MTWDPITFAAADASSLTAARPYPAVCIRRTTQTPTAHFSRGRGVGGPADAGGESPPAPDQRPCALLAGDWLLAGGGLIYVTADAAGSSLAVQLALGLTTAEAHAIGQAIYLLSTAVFTYSFPPLFLEPTQAASVRVQAQ